MKFLGYRKMVPRQTLEKGSSYNETKRNLTIE